jgi:hypothetical protein
MLHAGGQRVALGGHRAQRRQAAPEDAGLRALRLEQRPQREQVVRQSLRRARPAGPLAGQLPAPQSPGHGAAARGAPLDEAAEGAQLVLLLGGDVDDAVAAYRSRTQREGLPRPRRRPRPGQRRQRHARRVEEPQGRAQA